MLSSAKRMCTSFCHDESRRLTYQVFRLDYRSVVGYACNLGRDLRCAGPQVIAAAVPCGVATARSPGA